MVFTDVVAQFGILLGLSLAAGLVLGAIAYGVLRQVIQRMRARRPWLLGAPLDLLVRLGETLLGRAVPIVLGAAGLAVAGLVLAGATGAGGWMLLAAPFMAVLVAFGIAAAECFAFQQAALDTAERKEWSRLYRWG